MSVHDYENGMSDLIQATALIDDGVVVLKDGGLLAAWRYNGPDYSPEVAEAVRDRVGALLDYGRGWVFETNVVRVPSTTYPAWGTFPDAVSQLIETERIRNYTAPGRYFETQHYMSLSYFPPSTATEKAKGYFYESAEAVDLATESLNHFKTKIRDFEALCSTLFRMRRLKVEGKFDTLLRYIQLCITGQDKPFLSPDIAPLNLDYLFGVDVTCGTQPILAGKPMRVLAISPLPQIIYPAMLRNLEGLAMPFRLHGRAILLDPQEAAELHQLNLRRHRSKILPFLAKVLHTTGSPLNPRAVMLAEDANLASTLTENRSECAAMFSARMILIRDDEEKMAEAISAVQSCAEASHLDVRVETYNCMDTWCASLPGHQFYDIRQVTVRGWNVAGMSPLHSVWSGHRYHPSPKMPAQSSPLLVATAHGMSTYRHNLHVIDVGHTVVYGPTGNGKTTIFGLHAASLRRYPDAQVVMFDLNKTQYVLCKAVGGQFYDFGADKSLQLCPLAVLETTADLAWASNYIETLCAQNGLTITPTHTDHIGKAVEACSRSEDRSLTHFQARVMDAEVQTALQLYTVGNPISARLLDGESDSIADSPFTVFEMAELMGMNRKVYVAVLLHLFRRIERKVTPSRITGIFLDEARKMLKDAIFVARIENWLKELRNLNAFVMLAFQEIEDSQDSELHSVSEQQCKTKIFLPNPAVRGSFTRQAYGRLGLTSHQIDQIGAGRPRLEYFVNNSDTFSRISFDLESVALAFLASNSPRDRAAVDEMIALNPTGWPGDFLRSRDLPEWAQHFDVLQRREIV